LHTVCILCAPCIEDRCSNISKLNANKKTCQM
jgi:hypothetical protein